MSFPALSPSSHGGAREVWQVAVSLSEGGILSVHRDLQEREMSHGRWGAAH